MIEMLTYLSKFYFTSLLLVIAALILVVFGFKNYKKIKGLRIFIYYGIASLFQSITSIIINVYNPFHLYNSPFIENSINVFIVIEFVIFYTFLIKIISNKKAQNVMKVLLGTFLLLASYLCFVGGKFNSLPDSLSVIESFLIASGCLYYFFELFSFPSITTLSGNPNFWAIAGMFFLSAATIPLFLLRKSLDLNFPRLYVPLYSITFISYIVLFGCIINAFLCKTRAMKSSYSS